MRISGRGSKTGQCGKIIFCQRAEDDWQAHSTQGVQRWWDEREQIMEKTKEDLGQLPLWLDTKVRVQHGRGGQGAEY